MKNVVREVPARLEINMDIFKKDDLFKVVHKKSGDSRIYIVEDVTEDSLKLVSLKGGIVIVNKPDQMDYFDFTRMKIVEDDSVRSVDELNEKVEELSKEACEKLLDDFNKMMIRATINYIKYGENKYI